MADRRSSHSVTRMEIAVFFLLLVTAGLVIYIVVDKVQGRELSEDHDHVIKDEEMTVSRYPGYFRTNEEQEIYTRWTSYTLAQENSTRAKVSNDTTPAEQCRFICPDQFGEYQYNLNKPFQGAPIESFETGIQARRRRSLVDENFGSSHSDDHVNHLHSMHKRRAVVDNGGNEAAEEDEEVVWESQPVFHGCCKSTHKFSVFKLLPNRKGQLREIVRFANQSQYFLTQTCSQAKNCFGCVCAQESNWVSAVVKRVQFPLESESEYILDMVKIKGCCKCYNT